MSEYPQHWLLSEKSSAPEDQTRIYDQFTQASCTQGYHSLAEPSELQVPPASEPREILLAPYPSYTSYTITPMHPLIRNHTHPCIIEEQVNVTLEYDHLPSQELPGITEQYNFSFDGNMFSSIGNVLWPLVIPSNGAAGLHTPPITTDPLVHSPLRTSTVEPHIIEPVAAENDLRAVGSPQIQKAAGKRRKKDGIYQCQFRNAGCNATFTALHNLRYHLNAHRGLKPYKCSMCSYGADSPTALKRHTLKRHPST